MTAVLLEDLVAFGVQQFIIVGLAGGLQETAQVGDLIVADKAIRDEGTSRHYLPPAKLATPSVALTQQLCRALDAEDVPYTLGTTWTTDAPYRETHRQVKQYQREGVLTVEMEAAALFAVARHLSVPAAAAFIISDSMRNGRWQIDFDVQRAERGWQTLLDTIIKTDVILTRK